MFASVRGAKLPSIIIIPTPQVIIDEMIFPTIRGFGKTSGLWITRNTKQGSLAGTLNFNDGH